MRSSTLVKQVLAFAVVVLVLVVGSVAAGHLAYDRLVRPAVVTNTRVFEATAPSSMPPANRADLVAS
ncbi:MAG: hypothetical protein ACOH2F_18505 [Cellulomonas sp.]